MNLEEIVIKKIKDAEEKNDKTWLVPLEIAKTLNVEIIELIEHLRWAPVLNPNNIKENKELVSKIKPLIDEISLRANVLKTLFEQ